jgi:ATP-dependent Clp protease ATP-binding subunit ClpC
VGDAIRRSRSGLKDPRRPIGSFIFMGSTGVGKTELAKALAEFMFDSEDALLRIDMSEYRERHTVSRLVGAPPGYVGFEDGGQLTEAVRRRPYRVILFDEIEKAHPEVWNVLLQVLDDGRLTDGQGHVVDFRNTVIIMTSNIGTELAGRGGTIGFGGVMLDEVEERFAAGVHDALKRAFRPEFLNRIDEVIVFHQLRREHIEQIVELQAAELANRIAEKGLHLELSPAARAWLAEQGYDPDYGARPLRRVIQRMVEAPLSKRIIAGEFEVGDTIVVEMAPPAEAESTDGTPAQDSIGHLVFSRREAEPIPLEDVLPRGRPESGTETGSSAAESNDGG